MKTPRPHPRASGVPSPLRALALLGGPLFSAACDGGPPTFAADVAPLVYENCSVCHRDGGPGPFTLLSYDDVASRIDEIVRATGRGYMPPWLPAHTDEPFAGERGLSEAQIELLQAWAEAGAPAGDLASAPEPPSWPSGWALGEPDLVVEMEAPFAVPAGGGDLFHNFVLPLPLEMRRYVSGMELDPGNTTVVHHAMVSIDDTPSSRIEDARAAGPGFPGMVSTSQALAPGGFFVGWTPGKIPAMNPPGLAWPMEPGTDLVVQLHLRPVDEPQEVRARVALYFTDVPPEHTPVVLRLGGQTLDIPAGESEYVVEDSLRLPTAVRALAVYPHAHYIGKSMDFRAELPGGEVRRLLWIPDWDFNWQDAYPFEEPVELPAGTLLRIRYVFDNSAANPANPFDPPRRVVYGRQSSDEMAELHLQVLPADDGDLDALRLALAEKAEADQFEGWQHMLRLDPEDAEAHFGIGTVAQRDGDLDEAARRYARAVAAQPDFPQAHYNRGLVFEAQDRPDAALAAYGATLEYFPQHADAHNNLGALLATRGRAAEAEGHFRSALAIDSTHADAHNNLGNALREQGRLDPALEAYSASLQWQPGFVQAEVNRALTLLELGRIDEALTGIRAAASGSIEATAEPRLLMAWTLATDPDPALRRPSAAVALAEGLARLTGNGDPVVLDVLAAGYAAELDFEPAVGAARQALRLAQASGDVELAARIAARIRLYEAGRPFVRGG